MQKHVDEGQLPCVTTFVFKWRCAWWCTKCSKASLPLSLQRGGCDKLLIVSIHYKNSELFVTKTWPEYFQWKEVLLKAQLCASRNTFIKHAPFWSGFGSGTLRFAAGWEKRVVLYYPHVSYRNAAMDPERASGLFLYRGMISLRGRSCVSNIRLKTTVSWKRLQAEKNLKWMGLCLWTGTSFSSWPLGLSKDDTPTKELL